MTEPPSPSFAVPPAPVPAATDDALFAALLKVDRSESLVPLAAGLARELNEALTKILGSVTLARDRGTTEPLAGAERACLEARDLSRRLRALGQGRDGVRAAVAPGKLLAAAVEIAAAGTSAEITVAAPDSADPVWVDPDQMAQAFRNLVRNSLEAMTPAPPRPRVQLSAANAVLADGRISGLPAGDYVEFEVRDNGCGIAPENLEKIWEPFFTTKKHGAGLGLPAALAIVRRHGGQVGVDSTVGVGTVITIFLPRAQPSGQVEARRAPSARFRSGRVLVMDDDPEIRTVTGGLLEGLGYKCDLARDGDEALALYRRYFEVGRPHDAVLLDLAVKGAMGGAEAFEQLRLVDPDLRAIALSAGEGDLPSRHCLTLGFCGWLAKPYTRAELGEALQAVLG